MKFSLSFALKSFVISAAAAGMLTGCGPSDGLSDLASARHIFKALCKKLLRSLEIASLVCRLARSKIGQPI